MTPSKKTVIHLSVNLLLQSVIVCTLLFQGVTSIVPVASILLFVSAVCSALFAVVSLINLIPDSTENKDAS